jgi:thiol-disulfide isomerase/thioredoxin
MINKFIQTFLILFSFSLCLNAQSFQQAKPWMGIAIGENPNGVGVNEAIAGTPAAKAGIKRGDIIKKIDSTPMINPKQLIEYIQSKGVGNDVIVELERDNKLVSITLKLEARPDELELVRKKLIGKSFPDFKLATMSGKSHLTKKDIENTVTVIEFWATWCGPCVASHKKLSKFAEDHPSIKILAISNEKIDLVKAYNKKANPKFTILQESDSTIARFFMVSAIPTTAVIDKSGVIRFITIGSGSYQEEALNFALELDKKKE